MNIPSFLTARDFFNYYVAGLLWILEAMIISIPVDTYQRSLHWLKTFQTVTERMGVVLIGILFIIGPYLIGFVLTPVNVWVTKLLRYRFGDAKQWVTDYSEKNFHHRGKRLAQSKMRLIVRQMKEVFGEDKEIKESSLSKWFFTIRDYVINSKGEAASFAIRAQDLANFTESVILPFPIIFITAGIRCYSRSWVLGWVLVLAGVGSFCLLSFRYLKFRFYWVKHVYNSFLVVTSAENKLGVSDENKLQRS